MDVGLLKPVCFPLKLLKFMLIKFALTSFSSEPGGGGFGGSGPAGTTRAPTGKKGTNGTWEAVNVYLNGNTRDLTMNQVFAFPEQCQMLLNKADNLFFTNDTKDRERASLL